MAKIILKDREGLELGKIQGSCIKTILTSAEEQNVRAPVNCYQGICRVCVCDVLKGAKHIDPHANGQTIQSKQLEDGKIMSCLASIKPNTPADTEIVLQAQNP